MSMNFIIEKKKEQKLQAIKDSCKKNNTLKKRLRSIYCK